MHAYMRCNNCGYDLSGPEYIANVTDTTSFSNGAFYPDAALLALSAKADHDITCPHCHTKGDWSH